MSALSWIAEYPDRAHLMHAVRLLRDAGYTRLHVYSPHAVEELDAAIGAPRPRFAWVIALAGIAGAGAGYGAQWLLDAELYPVDVGGRAPHMPLAYVPITFEMGVLAAGLCAFFGVLVLARMLRLWDPVFEVAGFESATRAGYWLSIDAGDPRFDDERALEDLRATHPSRIERLEAAS
jgi:hypothetical protein